MIKALLKRSGLIMLVLLLAGVVCVSCSDDDDDDDKGGGGIKETVADKDARKSGGISESAKLVSKFMRTDRNTKDSDDRMIIALYFYDNGQWIHGVFRQDDGQNVKIDFSNNKTYTCHFGTKGIYEGDPTKNTSESNKVIITHKWYKNDGEDGDGNWYLVSNSENINNRGRVELTINGKTVKCDTWHILEFEDEYADE